MNKVQMVRRTALILGIMLVACAVVSRVIRWSEVAALQNSLQRDWEITFNVNAKPQYLPAFLDELADQLLAKAYEASRGKRNRDSVYHDRFQSLFRGPIRKLEIYYPEDLYADFGAAISRFRQLGSLTIFENDGDRPSKEHWKAAFHAITQLPNLRELEIGGDRITSETLLALAGAPKLKKLSITYAKLNPGFMAVLPPLPALTELHVEDIYRDEAALSTPNIAAGSAALPPCEHLDKLTFSGHWESEEEWETFLGSLVQFPNLQELKLSDDTLTNEALSALAGAPKLRKLSIVGGLDTSCVAALRMLPALKELSIASTLERPADANPAPGQYSPPGFSEANLAKLRAALPNVRVKAQ